jgi:hypothetical protein
MDRLIINRADINAKFTLSETALSKAIVCGSMYAVTFLSAQRLDVQHGDRLHCAAQRRNQVEGAVLIEGLMQEGADLETHRYHNPITLRWRAPFRVPTLLHAACEEANIPVARTLL